MDSNRYV